MKQVSFVTRIARVQNKFQRHQVSLVWIIQIPIRIRSEFLGHMTFLNYELFYIYSDLVPFFSNTKYVCISRFGSKKSLSFNGSFAGKASACRQQVYLCTISWNSFWRSFHILMQLHFHNIFLTSILYVNDRIFHKHLVRMKMHGFFCLFRKDFNPSCFV